jgi:putative copper export protein
MIGLEAALSALSYVALALTLGQLVAAGFLLPDGEPYDLRQSLRFGAAHMLLFFLAVALLALFLQGTKLQRGVPSLELLWRYLTQAQSGKVWLVRELYGAALVLFIYRCDRKDSGQIMLRWMALLAIPLVASRSLTSHAAAVREATWQIVGADALHLIATALWAGGIMALWRMFRYHANQPRETIASAAAAVQCFSRLALISVALLLLTGVYQCWIHLGTLAALRHTDYGNTLLLKLTLFGAMLSAGAINFLSTRRLLAHAAVERLNDSGVRGIAARRIGIESIFALLIFSATGLLTVLPPGVHAVHQQSSALPPPQTKSEIANVKRYLPAEGASVKIIEPKIGQVFASDQVPLKFTLTGAPRGHHVHAYVDGELMGMFQSKTGTLNGLKPGRHILELRVVTADHQSELEAFDRVEFTVK